MNEAYVVGVQAREGVAVAEDDGPYGGGQRLAAGAGRGHRHGEVAKLEHMLHSRSVMGSRQSQAAVCNC